MYLTKEQQNYIAIKTKSTPRSRSRVEEPFRINQKITAPAVRLVGANVAGGIYSLTEALKMAEDQELDLVEISAKANPPVCKVTDYAKFKYEYKKKQREIRAKAQKTVVKEIRLGPNTDEHDLEFKLKHATKFLQEGAKVKAYIYFAGRAIIFKERGEQLLLKFSQALEEYGKLEKFPKMEGRRMTLMIVPQATKK